MCRIEKDMILGDRMWMGNNVFIREGVKIGDEVIVSANSVVTKDIPTNAVWEDSSKILYIKNRK